MHQAICVHTPAADQLMTGLDIAVQVVHNAQMERFKATDQRDGDLLILPRTRCQGHHLFKDRLNLLALAVRFGDRSITGGLHFLDSQKLLDRPRNPIGRRLRPVISWLTSRELRFRLDGIGRVVGSVPVLLLPAITAEWVEERRHCLNADMQPRSPLLGKKMLCSRAKEEKPSVFTRIHGECTTALSSGAHMNDATDGSGPFFARTDDNHPEAEPD